MGEGGGGVAACTRNWEQVWEKPTIPVVADPTEVLHNCLVYKMVSFKSVN